MQPLSREHHDGLLFVWKLRQGLANYTGLETLRVFTGWYWKHHIRPHFFQEEKVLLPYMPAEHPLAQQLKNEHQAIRELIILVDRETEGFHLDRLASLLESHIRFEERELYQYLEETLTQEELNEIYKGLEDHPVCSDKEWPEPFWEKKKDQAS